MTTTTRTYADIAPQLAALSEQIIEQAGRMEEEINETEARALTDGSTPPWERINIVRNQVETLRYQALVLDAAADICSGRGTAAELCGMAWVLPAGYVAAPDPDVPSERPATPMQGRELRQHREALGVSQRELGAVLGIPWNTLARWERGAMTIQHPEMLRLALERLRQAPAV